jgi:hypothetical protein
MSIPSPGEKMALAFDSTSKFQPQKPFAQLKYISIFSIIVSLKIKMFYFFSISKRIILNFFGFNNVLKVQEVHLFGVPAASLFLHYTPTKLKIDMEGKDKFKQTMPRVRLSPSRDF